MEPFFAMLKQLCSEKNIQVKDIWNMDEISIATGLGVNGLVMGANEKRKVYIRGMDFYRSRHFYQRPFHNTGRYI